jgi:hypothetical protein
MQPHLHLLSRLLGGAALLCALSAQAAVIYRWVDESGRTQVSDVVPEKYRKSAIRVDSSESAVSPERKRQAEETAARTKALADEAERRRQSAQRPITPAASAPVATKRPAQSVTDDTDCDTWRRLYRESEDCFGPYRTTRGGTKGEAFEKCNPIPSPELKCGPVRE